MRWLLNLLYFAAFLCFLPVGIYRFIFQGRYRKGLQNRFGFAARKTAKEKCIWIHAVSLGEVNAAKGLIDILKKDCSEAEIVLSTTTDTGFSRAQKLYGDELSIFFFPLDFSFFIKRAFSRIKPSVCVLVELEIWPNFIFTADTCGAKTVVFNGRLSDKSFPKYERIKFFISKIFKKIDLFLVQTEKYADRFKALGASGDKITVTGSVKYDNACSLEELSGAEELCRQINLKESQMLITAGATGPGEEQIILDVYKELKGEFDNLRLAVVPRKPERFQQVHKIIENAGFGVKRYSRIKEDALEEDLEPSDVILGDTMGDLRKFYAASELIFVGRSLCPMGGSDMIEAAALGKFTAFGPHTFNFSESAELLVSAEAAVEVSGGQELADTFRRAAQDPQYRRKTGQAAKELIDANKGAGRLSAQEIEALL
ncbi:3-deoxy-D-manno-octulosonic acid transferase [Sedimentisphaera cyanobacteriorum]|uniref:3-deoxy-D-manno-octulosonic acid transferase n=1 Tax=Sedimentisphaera cyanobacteriorum TaxID=1940790 RepID=A0A1Q2HMI9_9BACT|nr:3-deoxy-D-manno-octulosonic acid transferase [Sedimentisphaera cyanobacteriorum]AQQ08474.1 3-deoxy-D-manno-octulosonic acid transferase [Sedimentisphaera cyanobacteriorum]